MWERYYLVVVVLFAIMVSLSVFPAVGVTQSEEIDGLVIDERTVEKTVTLEESQLTEVKTENSDGDNEIVIRSDLESFSISWDETKNIQIGISYEADGEISMSMFPNSEEYQSYHDGNVYCPVGEQAKAKAYTKEVTITRSEATEAMSSTAMCGGELDELYVVFSNPTSENIEMDVELEIVRYGIDSDSDGLADVNERERGTNPQNADTDGDGINDLKELEQGSDPTDEDSPHISVITTTPTPTPTEHTKSTSTTVYQTTGSETQESSDNVTKRGFFTNNPTSSFDLLNNPFNITTLGLIFSIVGIFFELTGGR